MATAFVAAGSNLRFGALGPAALLDEARRRIEALPGITFVRASSVHETEPMGRLDQPKYRNQVFALETSLEPRALLDALLSIERALGRERRERWGPRTIDLDIVLYGDRVVDEPGLTIPHPGMHERRFVLAPLVELAPGARHPILGTTAADLLARL